MVIEPVHCGSSIILKVRLFWDTLYTYIYINIHMFSPPRDLFLINNADFQTRCSPCKKVDVWLQVKDCPREIWCSLIHSPGDVKGRRMVENWASRRWHEDRCALWWTPLAELALAAYFGPHCKQVHVVRPASNWGQSVTCGVGGWAGYVFGRKTSRFSMIASMTFQISARTFRSIMSLLVVFFPHYVSAHWPTGPFWIGFHIPLSIMFLLWFRKSNNFLVLSSIVVMVYPSWNYRRRQSNRGALQWVVWARLQRKQVTKSFKSKIFEYYH